MSASYFTQQRPGRRIAAWLLFFPFLPVLVFTAASSPAALVLVTEGRARAVVVTADDAAPVARLAVEELVEHIRLATGVELTVRTESQAAEAEAVRIYIGETEAAARIGLEVDDLEPDGYFLGAGGDAWFIVGREDDREYNHRSGRNGTLYGVYDFLERAVGVRWLWPGELGTYVPRQSTLQVEAEAVEAKAMALDFRDFWAGYVTRALQDYQPQVERLAFSRQGLENYHRDLTVYLRRHRNGWTRPKTWVTHHRLWQRWGQDHPEWFKLNRQGERVGPTLCVTSQDLQRAIVEDYWDGESEVIMLGEADRRTYCHCDHCLAWDEPQPEDWPHHITSNRYARFAAKVRDLARERRPDADFLVTMFIYMDYFHKPTIDIDLSGVHAAFCPWFSGFNPFYPMSEEAHQRMMDTWRGWSRTGIRMHYRPNLLLAGYVMPHLSTWQAGEMFQFVIQHGATGGCFDSLHGHWSVKGPMLYLHMRLAVDPDLTIEEIRAEYFTAFGPAAGKVEAYFDYWEQYSREEAPGGGVTGGRAQWTPRLYPEESFEPPAQMLAAAVELARTSGRSEHVERVAFLQAGLEHARLARDFAGRLGSGGQAPADGEQFQAARQALLDLIEFRRRHEHLYISCYIAAAQGENRNLDIDVLLEAD